MDPLSEAFQHHTWATEQLITHLRKLPKAAFTASAPGVYGKFWPRCRTSSQRTRAICATWKALRHRPRPARTSSGRSTSSTTSCAIRRFAGASSCPTSASSTSPCRPRDQTGPAACHNLLLVQALHHGNDHRTQICTVLSSNGYPTPDLDVWRYWMERRADAPR